MLTRVESRDNGVMRLAIAFHRRNSIGRMVRIDGDDWRYIYRTTPEFDEWATIFMGMPGLKPYPWTNDPQHSGYKDIPGSDRFDFLRERGSRRDILVLDTEEQAMLFKLRWQDAP